VRIKILKHSTGIMDGVSLSHLLPGLVYEVPVSLGTWLVGRQNAEEDVTPRVGIVIPLDQTSAMFTGGISVSPAKDHEDDRARRLRRVQKNRR
jgi:hypothetical protein